MISLSIYLAVASAGVDARSQDAEDPLSLTPHPEGIEQK